MKTKAFFNTVGKGLRKHGPKIAAGIGGVLLLTGGYLLGREVPRYKKEVEEKENELEEGEKLPAKEKAKLIVKHFAAPAVVITGGAVSLCASVHEGEKRIANLASAAAAVSEIKAKEFAEYKEAAKEIVGEEEAKKIEGKFDENTKETRKSGLNLDYPTMAPDPGMCWCKDLLFGGKWFQTSGAILESVQTRYSTALKDEGLPACYTLNDIYNEIGHELIEAGDYFGFVYDRQKGDHMVDLRIDVTYENMMPILTIFPDVALINEDRFKKCDYNY